MDQSELKELTLRFEKNRHMAEKFLQQNPKSILVLRLALGISQKEFLKKINNEISQVALIRHEKGRSTRMNSKLVKELSSHVPEHLDSRIVIRNYKKFNDMKNGLHMTSERAKQLHAVWKQKTKRTQWQEWGRKGAMITNSQDRLTEQEKQVKSILDQVANISYKIHYQTKTKFISMNIDFVLFEKGKPKFFIEVTERKHDLSILCQAYAYRCRLLKERYPNAKVGIIIKEVPFSAKKIIENEFDFILNSNSIQNLSKFLQFRSL